MGVVPAKLAKSAGSEGGCPFLDLQCITKVATAEANKNQKLEIELEECLICNFNISKFQHVKHAGTQILRRTKNGKTDS